MKQEWKQQEKEKVKCIYCRHSVHPKTRDYDNTIRKICPNCGATLELTLKKKKLAERDW